MNKDVLYKLAQAEMALERAQNALLNLRQAIENDGKETAWFDNGHIIVNGTKYPILDFKIEWTKNKQLCRNFEAAYLGVHDVCINCGHSKGEHEKLG